MEAMPGMGLDVRGRVSRWLVRGEGVRGKSILGTQPHATPIQDIFKPRRFKFYRPHSVNRIVHRRSITLSRAMDQGYTRR